MTETKPTGTAVAAPPKPTLAAGGGISAIVPQDVEQAYRLATIVARSGMAPKSFEGNAERIMVAMLHGMELGLTPMTALQSIAVVNGMPTVWGDGALGLVRASGLLEDFEERFEDEQKTLAVCTVRRKGQKTPITRTFSSADAAKAGLLDKDKTPWRTYPHRMLQMRARSWALRDAFADILKGLHIREEVEDIEQLAAGSDGTYTPSPPRPTRAQLQQQTQPEPEPEQQTQPAADATDGWLISPEAFPTIALFEAEWLRQLSDVCTNTDDVDALLNDNDARLAMWSTDRSLAAKVGAMIADADATRDRLKGAA